MQALPFGRFGLAQTVLVSLLTLVAIALLGAVLAYWTWAWFAPRTEPRLDAPPALSTDASSASALFGTVPREQHVAAPTGIAIRLLGVMAASGGRRGYGVVQLDSKQILAVQEGDDLAPGVRLAEVHADHVILERNGLRETLAWPDRKGTVSPAPRAAVSVEQQAAQTAAAQAAERVAPRARGGAGRRNNSD